MSLLNVNFGMTCIIHKMLVLLKNHFKYFKDRVFECFKKSNFLQHMTMERLSLEEENIIKI